MEPRNVLFLALVIGYVAFINAQDCGNVKYSSELIYGGNYTKRDQYPWLCSLHDVDSDEFFCGATLISARHILTGNCLIF